MKQKTILTLLLLAAALLFTTNIFAYDVEVDGICYDLNTYDNHRTIDNVAEVVVGNYSGNVVIPEKISHEGVAYTVASIRFSAFANSAGLTSVTMPNTVTCIGDFCFQNSKDLTTVTLSSSLTSIRFRVFFGCTALTSMVIPNSVTSIGGDAFYGCTNLKSIVIPNSVTSIGSYAFYGCIGLTAVDIPNSVTYIDDCAFYGCSSLSSVTLPNAVTKIGERTFLDCKNLASVKIPNTVTCIYYSAFQNCSNLKDVTVEWDNPLYVNQWHLIFTNCPLASATLHVPVGTADKYREAETWRDFGNIVEYDPTGILQVENGTHEIKNGKYIQNGSIVIIKDGKEYTIDGKN